MGVHMHTHMRVFLNDFGLYVYFVCMCVCVRVCACVRLRVSVLHACCVHMLRTCVAVYDAAPAYQNSELF